MLVTLTRTRAQGANVQPATVGNSRCGSHNSRGSVGTLSSGDAVTPPPALAALRKRSGRQAPAKSQSVAQILVTKATPAHALSKEHRHKHRLLQHLQLKQLVSEPTGSAQLDANSKRSNAEPSHS